MNIELKKATADTKALARQMVLEDPHDLFVSLKADKKDITRAFDFMLGVGSGLCYLASICKDDEEVGFALAFRTVDDVLNLAYGIKPEFRRQGIMTKALTDIKSSTGDDELRLHVYDHNPVGHAFASSVSESTYDDLQEPGAYYELPAPIIGNGVTVYDLNDFAI